MSGRAVECVADGFAFVEGPRWHRGRLYFSDVAGRRVHALDTDGSVATVCEVPGQPSGLGFTPEGDLLVVSMLDRRLLRLDGDALVEVADLTELAPFHLNDMVVDSVGRAYVGNFGSNFEEEPIRPTCVIRVEPDGTASIAAESMIFPNGTAISPDGTTLLVAESFAFRITAFDVLKDGSLTRRREWARFAPEPAADLSAVLASDATIPDGICLDAEGALWVAHPKGRGALRMSEGGEVMDHIPTGDLAPYAVALGGQDRRTLYICAALPLGAADPGGGRRGCVLACRVDVPGAGLP